MPVFNVGTDSQFEQLLGAHPDQPILVDFYASWCQPCLRVAPTVMALSDRLINLKFVKVDVDHCKESAKKFGITAMPTFKVLLNGSVVDSLQGANPAALEALAEKWNGKVETPISLVEGQIELSRYYAINGVECLNQEDDCDLLGFLEGKSQLVSDCDEQLIINVPFNIPVKIHSLYFRASGPHAPKSIKVFINNPHTMDFDRAMLSDGVQSFELDAEKLDEGEIVTLRFVKFQNVQNIQFFIQDNQGGKDTTIIDELKIFGMPFSGVNMNDFKRVSVMNVDRLMIDLDVSQLEAIQKDLTHETEVKKEELRQMVGRRYRDVLDASNTLIILGEISNNFSNKLSETQSIIKRTSKKNIQVVEPKNGSDSKFLAINGLMSSINSKNGLTSVYMMLLLERMVADLAQNQVKNEDLLQLLRNFKQTLLNKRKTMDSGLLSDLGAMEGVKECSDQLLAIGVLKTMSTEDFVKCFFDSKREFILDFIKNDGTLEEVIIKVRDTLKMFEEIFGNDGMLYSVFSNLNDSSWKPKGLEFIMNDQLFATNQLIEKEISSINKNSGNQNLPELSKETQKAYCINFIDTLSTDVKPALGLMCDDFKDCSEIVEFLCMLSDTFKSSVFKGPGAKYCFNALFGNTLVEKFKALTVNQLGVASSIFSKKGKIINLKPQNLFAKWMAKFDESITAGVSHELRQVVEEFFIEVSAIHSLVIKFCNYRLDDTNEDLMETFADSIVEMIKNLIDEERNSNSKIEEYEIIPIYSTKFDLESWLGKFRILLGLIQHEPPTLSECMNDNFAKIGDLNTVLTKAAENTLCIFLDHLIALNLSSSDMQRMIVNCSEPLKWLDILQEFESVVVDETVTVKVPTKLNLYIFMFLYEITNSLNVKGIGHLMTRQSTRHLNNKLGCILSKYLKETAEQCSPFSEIVLQLLLDAKILFSMFLNEKFLEVIKILEDKMNGIDVELITPFLNSNSTLFIQKTYMLFGLLQTEQINTKGVGNKLASSSGITELYPRILNAPKLPMLPRLSSVNKDSNAARHREFQYDDQGAGSKSAANVVDSINSMVSKFSNNWFKS
uniref:Thioredoxin n=1 Tax=Rhabditophanes sp. KR3021 TaxID=114890 RepID=A0AC35TUT4_9BILA